MSTPFIGEIQAFAFAWASDGFNDAWLPCFGQVAPIQKYATLYALIGTTYGGNGTTNFVLPNLNGTVAIGQGSGNGLQPRIIGQQVGESAVSLISNQMARHTHGLQMGVRGATNATASPGTASNLAAIDPGDTGFVKPPATTTLSANAVALTGQNLPHNNMQPTQALVWCIAYTGIYPSFS